jgi:hypothetical protein
MGRGTLSRGFRAWSLVRSWCVKPEVKFGCETPAATAQTRPDAELIHRRAAGEPLRDLARAYGVTHTTLSRYFDRPEVSKQLTEAGRQRRAAERAIASRRSADQRIEREVRRKAKEQIERERPWRERVEAEARRSRPPPTPCAARTLGRKFTPAPAAELRTSIAEGWSIPRLSRERPKPWLPVAVMQPPQWQRTRSRGSPRTPQRTPLLRSQEQDARLAGDQPWLTAMSPMMPTA